MPQITLPDGTALQFAAPISAMQLAQEISPALAKATLAAKVNDQLVDVACLIEEDATVTLITHKSKEALELIRHDAAHVMAQAVQELYPNTQVTIGPVIENGFYYDFARDQSFTEEDLQNIQSRMDEIVARDLPIVRETIPRQQAIELFERMGEKYKVEIIKAIPEQETISIYRQGQWFDVCRGPHLPSTGKLPKAFQLMKVAGAYWRGDSQNKMLQRIYGTAWMDKPALKQYLHQLEEAEKRDHRRIGRRLDLFHIQEEAPGMVFWHDKGWTIYKTIEDYLRKQLYQRGYQEINTPQIVDCSLWEKSGHSEKFSEGMFFVESEGRQFAIKPMNCPCHVQVFNQGLKSYRDLPLRLAEFGSCHRNELSGSLHGLMRVRGFIQDDAHIFCTESQIHTEVVNFIDFLHAVYRDFGFTQIIYRLATRPKQRVGSQQSWDKAEQALADALDSQQLVWETLPEEGAFYGPKIEFSLKDCIGRIWQCGTIQVDFSMPGRLGAQYVDEQNQRQTPVMLHRAILGSFERFIGILLEHYAGSLPTWLAPVQVMVINITHLHEAYAENIQQLLQNRAIRAQSDLRNEKINLKIRQASIQRIPYQLVVGDREMTDNTVTVRTRSGQNLKAMPVETFIHQLQEEMSSYGQMTLEAG